MSERKANLIAGMDSISSLNSGLTNKIYPVGSIYMSVNSTNPAVLFGGNWEQLKDRFLLAAGDTYAAGSTGGESQHKLTESEMPSHSHTERIGDTSRPQSINPLRRAIPNGVRGGVKLDTPFTDNGLGEDVTTDLTGGSQPHNNMPPYLAVYAWKRIA